VIADDQQPPVAGEATPAWGLHRDPRHRLQRRQREDLDAVCAPRHRPVRQRLRRRAGSYVAGTLGDGDHPAVWTDVEVLREEVELTPPRNGVASHVPEPEHPVLPLGDQEAAVGREPGPEHRDGAGGVAFSVAADAYILVSAVALATRCNQKGLDRTFVCT
jgi:hypothetical protein